MGLEGTRTKLTSPRLTAIIDSLQYLEENIKEHANSLEYYLKYYDDVLEPEIKKAFETLVKRSQNMGKIYKKLGEKVYEKWREVWDSEGRPHY